MTTTTCVRDFREPVIALLDLLDASLNQITRQLGRSDGSHYSFAEAIRSRNMTHRQNDPDSTASTMPR